MHWLNHLLTQSVCLSVCLSALSVIFCISVLSRISNIYIMLQPSTSGRVYQPSLSLLQLYQCNSIKKDIKHLCVAHVLQGRNILNKNQL